MQKLKNGQNLFEFMPIIVISIVILADYPYLYEAIGYDFFAFKYSINYNGRDFTNIFSYWRFLISIFVPLLAGCVALVISQSFKFNTIKMRAYNRDSLSDYITNFILGQKYVCMLCLGMELGFFSNGYVSVDYWNYQAKFY